ncbi:MAG: hypothetical protein ACREAR_08090 [Nitrosotalea sp.]
MSGNDKDKTDSDELGTGIDKSLSNDKSYLTNDADPVETNTNSESQNKDLDK